MPALFLTAAEVAAAEAAAIAAAEAAAVHAAQVAAAQAAQVAAAEAATQAAATAAAEQAAAATTQTATSGIQTLAQEVTGAQPTGIETLNMAQPPVTGQAPTVNDQVLQVFRDAQANNVSMTGPEFLNNSLAGANTSFAPVTTPVDATFNAAQPFANPTYVTPPPAPVLPATPAAVPPAGATPAAPQLDYGFSRPDMGGAGGVQQGFGGTGMQAQLTPEQLAGPNQYSVNQGLNYQSPLSASVNTPPTPAPSGIEGLFNKGLDYVKQNPLTSLMGANTLLTALNKPEPEEKKKYQSTFKSNLYTGYTPIQPTPYQPQYAVGGLADLGGYSDGGRMLKGPGDGMSDDIPATIAGKQPARLANEEFVIPADVVSHLGNGSSEAGAKQLYKMMDRIRKARTGTKKQGKQINPEKYLA
jgi:hypothetical protein